ncbi:MAG: BatA domain-containing protein [Lentisphaeria bacterium]
MGWVQPYMLIGFAALAVPVVIHLVRSRRFESARLGSIRFLRQALDESARWRRLHNLLLLSARLLVFALLCLVFARPFFDTADAAASEQPDVVLLIDSSGSMAAPGAHGTLLDTAFALAVDRIRELPGNARVTTAYFADTVQETTLDTKPAAAGRTDYAAALAWARNRLVVSPSRHKRIILITDCQAAGLPDTTLPDWPLDLAVELHTLTAAAVWNTAILNVACRYPYPGVDSGIEVTIVMHGDGPATPLDLTLNVAGDEPVALQCSPGTPTAILLPWSSTSTGIRHGEVRIASDDPWPGDNVRHFAVPIQPPARVVLVDGDPANATATGAERFESDTYFLHKTLEMRDRDRGHSPFAVDVRTAPGDLAGVRVIALCNVNPLGAGEVERLAAFVRDGGSLIYFLGDNTAMGFFNDLHRRGLFPAPISERPVAIPQPFTEWQQDHPALQLFRSRETGDLSRLVFRSAFHLEAEPDAVLTSLSSGEPAIVESTLGNGRVMAVANPCDRDWTDWPTERTFLPLMRELFTYLARTEATAPVTVRAAGLAERRAPGFYPDAPRTVVATDPRETDPAPLDEAAFRDRLGIGPAPAAALAPAAPELAATAEPGEIWRYLAIFLLLMLTLESCLADRGTVH